MLTYKIIYTNKNTREKTRDIIIQSSSLQSAYQIAYTDIHTHERCKVYIVIDSTEALQEASKHIVKQATANMLIREGGTVQHRLYNAIRQATPTDNDILDCLQVVSLALWEHKDKDIEVAYKEAHKALNHQLYADNKIVLSVTARRTAYIEDIQDDVFAYEHPLIDCECTYNANTTKIISELMQRLTPIQKRVIEYISNGVSLRQIADIMGRSHSTIAEHKQAIHKKAIRLLNEQKAV